MKKFYFLSTAMLFVCFSFYANAQNVNVTSTGGLDSATYPTLGAVIIAINSGTHTGDITITILNNFVEPTTICLNASGTGSANYTSIIIEPGPGSAPICITTNDTATFQFCGADNVTIDGGPLKRLCFINTSKLSNSAGIQFSHAISPTDTVGARNNTIMNCQISCGVRTDSAGSNQSFGIFVGGATIGLTNQGRDNDSNRFIENIITKCTYGISIIGGGAGNNNDFNVINGNIIGPSSHGPDQIGRWGIFTQFQNNCIISQNTVQYVGGPFSQGLTGADRGGIGIGGNSWSSTPGLTTGGNYTVTRNKVNNILEEQTFSAVGILCATTRSGVNTNNVIANNEIYNVRANGTLGNAGIGIGHNGNNSGDRIVYNSVYMAGDIDPPGTFTATQSNTGIRIATLTDSVTTVKNNSIYVSLNSNNASLFHSCIQMPDSSYKFGAAELDNNDYFPGSPANPQMRIGALGTTSLPTRIYGTLTAWRTVFTPFPQDINSISADPLYSLSGPNYLIPSSVLSPLKMAADPIPGITTDILGELRNAFQPTIGGYEYDSLTLPVELSALTATVLNRRNVRLNWTTASEINNSGFEVQRSMVNPEGSGQVGEWSMIGFINGNGTSATHHNYLYTDRGLSTGKYNYRLKQIDINGNFEYFNLSDYIEIGVPSVYNLSQNYPNPFNPTAKIDYDIPYDGKVSIVLYDISGRELATLVNDIKAAGYYSIHFNASNFASGTYFYRIVAGNFAATKKMLLVK